jgi:hypothetical protein
MTSEWQSYDDKLAACRYDPDWSFGAECGSLLGQVIDRWEGR